MVAYVVLIRSLDHSTIIYESPEFVPLLRLAWNKQDHNYLATFAMDQNKVVIVDIRYAPMLFKMSSVTL